MDSDKKFQQPKYGSSGKLPGRLIKVVAIVNFLFAVTAIAIIPTGAATAAIVESNITISPALRFDNLDWNTAGTPGGTSPNVLSELKWNDISSLQLQLGTEILINRRWYIKGYTDYGYIYGGDNRDSDYLGDNRTQEVSRSENDAGKGEVLDSSISFGIFLPLYDSEAHATLVAIPQIGYSVHNQHLHSRDGYQTIPATGSFSGLDSTYETQWDGLWLGIDLRFQSSYYSTLIFRYEYHTADYYAEANWNLRDDLQHPTSVEQSTEGTGNIIVLGWHKELDKDWLIGLDFTWQRWTTDAGKDRTFYSNGTYYETRLNEVNWDSSSLTFIVGKFFPAF